MPETVFLPMVVDSDPDTINNGQPVAVLLRVDDAMRERIGRAAALVDEDAASQLTLSLLPEQAKWLDKIGYSGNEAARGVAPIPGWLDDPRQVRLCGPNGAMSGEAHEFMEREADEFEDAHYGASVVHPHQMDPDAYLDASRPPITMTICIGKGRGRGDGLDFSLHACSDEWSVGTVVQEMAWYPDVFSEPVPAERLVQALDASVRMIDEMMLGGLTTHGLRTLVEQNLKPARAVLRAAQGQVAAPVQEQPPVGAFQPSNAGRSILDLLPRPRG